MENGKRKNPRGEPFIFNPEHRSEYVARLGKILGIEEPGTSMDSSFPVNGHELHPGDGTSLVSPAPTPDEVRAVDGGQDAGLQLNNES